MRTNLPGRRLQVVGLAAFAVLLVSAMTVAFTNASGARQIAVNSELLQWSNATSGAAAVTRAAVNQALIFAVDEQLGVSTAESTAIAIEEAERTTDGLRALADHAPPDLAAVAAMAVSVADEADKITSLLLDGDVAEGASVLNARFALLYGDLSDALAGAQHVYAAEIDAAESAATRIENALQWTAYLLVPGIAILLYRVVLRRRFERRRVEFEARLSAERELNLAKDEIIAGISHELRTPLTSILGFSQHLIEEGITDREEALELLTVIHHDSQELARMVEDLLTAARLESQALTYDLSRVDIAAEAVSIVEQLRRDDIEIRGAAHAPVLADAGRIRQILRNLLSNAIQHGGPKVYLEIGTDDGDATCDVVDDGEGVPEAIADRLFERFVHEGSQSLLTGSVGLGLAIARTLAHEMGGDVTHRRESGLTVFTLRMPLMDEAAHAGEPVAGENGHRRGGMPTHMGQRGRATPPGTTKARLRS